MGGGYAATGAAALANQAVGQGDEQIGRHACVTRGAVAMPAEFDAEVAKQLGKVDVCRRMTEGCRQVRGVEIRRFMPGPACACRLAADDGKVEADEVADRDRAFEAFGDAAESLSEGRRAGQLRPVEAVDCRGAGRDGDAGIDQEVERGLLCDAQTFVDADRRKGNDAIAPGVEARRLAVDRHQRQAFERRMGGAAPAAVRRRAAQVSAEEIGNGHCPDPTSSSPSGVTTSSLLSRSLKAINPKAKALDNTMRLSTGSRGMKGRG